MTRLHSFRSLALLLVTATLFTVGCTAPQYATRDSQTDRQRPTTWSTPLPSETSGTVATTSPAANPTTTNEVPGATAASADAAIPTFGYANWYSPAFHGATTRSGEAYNHEALTAAHPTLPFGTWVRVVNPTNQREVRVRVNDRMMASRDHVIDLSGAAAQQLGLLDGGITKVHIYPETAATVATQPPATERPYSSGSVYGNALPTAADQPTPQPTSAYVPPTSTTTSPSTGQGSYTLQIGAFRNATSATDVKNSVAGTWIKEVQRDGAPMYLVLYKEYTSHALATADKSTLMARGHQSFVKQF
ncbi:MAG: septal ring lytic transglycosylase RlpA family protein [Bacteroidota bacterium]